MCRGTAAGVAALLVIVGSLPAQEKKPAERAKELVEQLLDVKEPYLGRQFFYHGAFVPYSHSPGYRALKDPNDPFLALVRLGPEAVPALLNHLDDPRKTKSAMEHPGGFGWMSIGCDKGDEGKVEEKPEKGAFGGLRYTFRVGDFCYAALGQILNRDYDLARYQPSAIYFVTSVPYSKQLVAGVRKEWRGFAAEKHGELLARDFDTERSGGASVRLAYYYPELLETCALRQLKRGNTEVIENLRFDRSKRLDAAVRDVLAKTDDDSLAADCIERLAGRGFDKDIGDYIARRSRAADAGDLKKLKCKLGWTALHAAVDADIPALVEQALSERVDVNARSKSGETALHLTTEYGRAEALEMLLRAKADPNVADANGKLPIEDMAFGDNQECVRRLVAAGSKAPGVYVAVVLGNAKQLADLLRAKPELANARNRYGTALLQMAAERGDTDTLKVLLDAKADIDAVGVQTNRGSSEQHTALHAAIKGGKTHAAKMLLERGANPNLADAWKRTPLHFVAGGRDIEIVKALLARNVDLTVEDGFGRPLLDSASKDVRDAVEEWKKSKK